VKNEKTGFILHFKTMSYSKNTTVTPPSGLPS